MEGEHFDGCDGMCVMAVWLIVFIATPFVGGWTVFRMYWDRTEGTDNLALVIFVAFFPLVPRDSLGCHLSHLQPGSPRRRQLARCSLAIDVAYLPVSLHDPSDRRNVPSESLCEQ